MTNNESWNPASLYFREQPEWRFAMSLLAAGIQYGFHLQNVSGRETRKNKETHRFHWWVLAYSD